jgi:hypothetical protein
MGINQIPYQSLLSFRPLLRELEKKAKTKNAAESILAELIVQKVQEHLEYFEYLQHQGLIGPEIEDLKLGKLQGVQGLRALRVSVVL